MTSLRAAVRQRWRDDSGQLSVLVLGLTVIAMTLIIGGLAVTSVQISRMRLLDAADSAALGATDDGAERIYDDGVGTDLPLDDASVRESAATHLSERSRPHGLESWAVAPGTGSPDGRTAVVVLTGEADLPLIGGLLQSPGACGFDTPAAMAAAGRIVDRGRPEPAAAVRRVVLTGAVGGLQRELESAPVIAGVPEASRLRHCGILACRRQGHPG